MILVLANKNGNKIEYTQKTSKSLYQKGMSFLSKLAKAIKSFRIDSISPVIYEFEKLLEEYQKVGIYIEDMNDIDSKDYKIFYEKDRDEALKSEPDIELEKFYEGMNDGWNKITKSFYDIIKSDSYREKIIEDSLLAVCILGSIFGL